MSQEQAYQLALMFFRAGKRGEPMPLIEDEQHRATLRDLFNKGRKAARLPINA